MPRIISVVSGKGGVGKTTVSVNLAYALSSRFNQKVAVVDCNITSSHLGLHLGIYGVPTTLNDILKKNTNIQHSLYNYLPNMQILPASLSLSDLGGVDIKRLGKILRSSFDNYDYVILDSAAGFGKEAISAMLASDEILFVTTPDIPSVTDIVRGKDLADKLKLKTLGIVLNRVRRKNYELNESEISHMAGMQILESIPEDEKILESLGMKTPILIYRPNSKISISYLKLASILSGIPYKEPKQNIFSRIADLLRK